MWFVVYVLIQPVDRKEFVERTFPFGYSYIVYKEGDRYYAKSSSGLVEFSGIDVANVIQYAADSTYNKGGGRVFVIDIEEPPGIIYRPGVSVWYNRPYLYVKDVPVLELLSEIDTGIYGTTADLDRNIIVENDIMYAMASYYYNKLAIYDVRDPRNPRLLSISNVNTGVTLWKVGDFIINTTGSGVQVLDVRDPKNPVVVSSLNLGSWGHGSFLHGNYLFLCQHIAGKLVIIDVSNPANPVVVSTISDSTYLSSPHDVFVEGKYAYVTNYNVTSSKYGLAILDVSNPYSPRIESGALPGIKRSYLVKHGTYLFLGSHYDSTDMIVVDVSDPKNVSVVKTYGFNEIDAGYWMDVYGDWLVADSGRNKNIRLINLYTLNVDYELYLPDIAMSRNAYVYKDLLFTSLSKYDGTNYRWYIRIYRFRHDNMPYAVAKNIARKIEWALYSAKYYVKKRNSGVATILAGQTRVTVAHNLITTPSRILVTPYGNARVWVENITSTSFDIVTDMAPTADLQVAWYAEV